LQTLPASAGRAQVEAALQGQTSFTKSFLEKRLQLIAQELMEATSGGTMPFKLRMGVKFRDGTWNPKSEPLEIEVVADSLLQQPALEAQIQAFVDQVPARKQRFRIASPRGPPAPEQLITLRDENSLLETYQSHAFDNAGVYTMTGRTGGLNYIFVPSKVLLHPCDEALLPRTGRNPRH